MAIKQKTNKEKNSPPRYEVIAKNLRKHIESLNTGDMLPPERNLASHYSVSYMTIRRTLDVLAQEGYIKRYQGRGTVVIDRAAVGEIAIVIRPKLLRQCGSTYYRIAHSALLEKIKELYPRWQVRLHTGEETERGEDFPASLDLLDPDVRANLRGVFTFHPLYELREKLEKSGIPIVSFSHALRDKNTHRVMFNYEMLYQQAIDHLLEVGCRKTGLIWNGNRKICPESTIGSAEYFENMAEKQGLTCPDEWIACHPNITSEQAGYEIFMDMWQKPNKPDSVFVNDDVVCWGVLRAILHLGIKLPDDLRLITEATQGVEFPYHLPITKIQFDPFEQISKGIELMTKLIHGQQKEERILIPSVLVKGQTT